MDFIAICSVKFHALKGAAEALIPLRMAAHSLAAGIGGGGVRGETFWHQGSCGPSHGVCRYFGPSLRSLPSQAFL